MNKFILSIIYLLCFDVTNYSQNDENPMQYELNIVNQFYGRTIRVQVYPISMVFNGVNMYGNGGYYTLKALNPQPYPSSNSGPWWDYVNGVGVYKDSQGNHIRQYWDLNYNNHVVFNF